MNDATRRRIRTTFQTIVGVAPVLLVAVPVALQYAEVALPAKAYAVLASAAAVIVAIASYVTRIMANPVVAAFIERRLPWLAASDPTMLNDPAETDAGVDLTPVDDIPAVAAKLPVPGTPSRTTFDEN